MFLDYIFYETNITFLESVSIFDLQLRANITLILIFSFIWSIKHITVADSRTIFASSVITVNIFGCLFFKEKFGIVTAIVSFIALCGIVVMTKPPFITGGNEFSMKTLVIFM